MSSNEPDTRTKILNATWKLMESRRGIGVRMSDIAKQAGVSRQALYLHFATRTELISATTKYVDDVMGLEQHLKRVMEAQSAVEALDAYIDGWAMHLPNIYGMAKALLIARDSDEASATAWEGCMGSHRTACGDIVASLQAEGRLLPEWSKEDATAMLWTTLSFQTWEQLMVECNWSAAQYAKGIKTLLHNTFIA